MLVNAEDRYRKWPDGSSLDLKYFFYTAHNAKVIFKLSGGIVNIFCDNYRFLSADLIELADELRKIDNALYGDKK